MGRSKSQRIRVEKQQTVKLNKERQLAQQRDHDQISSDSDNIGDDVDKQELIPWNQRLQVKVELPSFREPPETFGKSKFIDDEMEKNVNLEEVNENSNEIGAKEIVLLHSNESHEDLVKNYCELPHDLLRCVAESLNSAMDHENFRLVCRNWGEAAHPIRYFPIEASAIEFPWLMFFQEKDTCSSIIDPTCNMRYYMTISELSAGCKVQYSVDGWLLVTQGAKVFFFEPFSKTKISLPDLPEDSDFDCMSFSSAPTCSDWIVFSISSKTWRRLQIMSLRSGDEEWNTIDYETEANFRSYGSGPVFHNHKFYYLRRDGGLATFWWQANAIQCRIWTNAGSSTELVLLKNTCRGYLVSCEDDLHLVVVGGLPKNLINMYKLDSLAQKWKRTEITGDFSFFISDTSSFAVSTTNTTVQTPINLPLLSTIFASGISWTPQNSYVLILGLYERKKFICATWIQPKVIRGYR